MGRMGSFFPISIRGWRQNLGLNKRLEKTFHEILELNKSFFTSIYIDYQS